MDDYETSAQALENAVLRISKEGKLEGNDNILTFAFDPKRSTYQSISYSMYMLFLSD